MRTAIEHRTPDVGGDGTGGAVPAHCYPAYRRVFPLPYQSGEYLSYYSITLTSHGRAQAASPAPSASEVGTRGFMRHRIAGRS